MDVPTMLKQARKRHGWSQEQAIVRFERISHAMKLNVPSRSSLRTLFSMFENNRREVPEAYRSVFCELYRATSDELGFAAKQTIITPSPPALPRAAPNSPSPEIINYLSNVLTEHSKADALLGPIYLVPAVQAQLPLIDQLCNSARGADRREILTVATKFAEFCGWLYQDSGDTECAMHWTNRALDYAQELGDPVFIAYALMRKSNIATEAGQPGQGLGLANAALKAAPVHMPRLRAVSLRQLANAHALLSEPREFETAVNDAVQWANEATPQTQFDKASYCTPSYIEMEAGMSWVLLGNPRKAITAFEHALSRWPAAAQTRDKGLCLARLATASAVHGEIGRAVQAGTDALSIAQQTGSARIRAQLTALHDHLTPVIAHPDVQDLKQRLARLAHSV